MPRAGRMGYAILSGNLDEEDMVIEIEDEYFVTCRYFVELEPAPGKRARVFGYEDNEEDPSEVETGEWDAARECVGLWDAHGDVAWYAHEDAGARSEDGDSMDSGAESLASLQARAGAVRTRAEPYRAPALTVIPLRRPLAGAAAASRGQRAFQPPPSRALSAARYLDDDPEPEPDLALFTWTNSGDGRMPINECFDLVFPIPQDGAYQLDSYVDPEQIRQPDREPVFGGIVWGVHKRSGRVYVQEVLDTFASQADPELQDLHGQDWNRPQSLEGRFLLAVNRKSTRLMHPDAVEARMHTAQTEDTRRGGLELTFQSEPKYAATDDTDHSPGELFLNPRFRFAGDGHTQQIAAGAQVEAVPANDLTRVGGPGRFAHVVSSTYRVSESVFLALRRRRLPLLPVPGKNGSFAHRRREDGLSPEDRHAGWARSVMALRKRREWVEVSKPRDKHTHKGRDHDVHFHGSRPPRGSIGFLQCGSRVGPATVGSTVGHRRRYAARHLKGRAFQTWEEKTMYSMRVQRYAKHAEFRAVRYAFEYWLEVALDWMITPASGGRRELPASEARRRKRVALPPDTLERMRLGAQTMEKVGMSMWEYRLLSVYFKKLKEAHSDELCRWMHSYRMRRFIEAWYAYAISNSARQTASGGIFGAVYVPPRQVGAARELRASLPSREGWRGRWNPAPDILQPVRSDRPASGRWAAGAVRETSLLKIHRAQGRQHGGRPSSSLLLQSRLDDEQPQMLLACGADGGGNAPPRQLRLL